MPRTVGVALFLFAAISLLCQQTLPSKEDLVRGILRGDPALIYEAGKSADKSIAYFLQQQKQTGSTSSGRRAASLAFAKLVDDRQQLQQIFCEFEASGSITAELREEIVYVGGRFAILTSAAALTKRIVSPSVPPIAFQTAGPMDPADAALSILPRLVPRPPTSGFALNSSTRREDQIRIWREWIRSHESEIEQMKPFGKGVIFSRAGCRGTRQHMEGIKNRRY